MRIAFVHPRFPSAEGTGATHSATQIVSGLADAGHDIRVYCPQLPDKEPETTDLELRHLAGNSRHPHTNTRLNKEIVSRLGELRTFDVVHSYMTPLIPSIACVGEDSDVKTVVTLNAYGGTCAKNDLRYLDQMQCKQKSNLKCLNCISRSGFSNEHGYLYNTASELFSLRLINIGENRLLHIDGFQALSNHVMTTYSNFGFPEERIHVIPNILDKKFLIEHQSDFSDPYHLVYIGGLEKHKGVQMLPDIMSYLKINSDMNFNLTIVGDGGLYSDLQNEFEQQELSSRVTFTGQISNDKLPALYAEHDLFVYPGIWNEPFGRVFIESLAAGTPIVGTDVGALENIAGSAGVVTEPIPEKLAETINQLVKSTRIERLANNTKNEACRFSEEQVIKDFENLYSKMFS